MRYSLFLLLVCAATLPAQDADPGRLTLKGAARDATARTATAVNWVPPSAIAWRHVTISNWPL